MKKGKGGGTGIRDFFRRIDRGFEILQQVPIHIQLGVQIECNVIILRTSVY